MAKNLKKIILDSSQPPSFQQLQTMEQKPAPGRKFKPTKSDKTTGRRKELELPALPIMTKQGCL